MGIVIRSAYYWSILLSYAGSAIIYKRAKSTITRDTREDTREEGDGQITTEERNDNAKWIEHHLSTDWLDTTDSSPLQLSRALPIRHGV